MELKGRGVLGWGRAQRSEMLEVVSMEFRIQERILEEV